MPDQDKVVLDSSSFKALASETRVLILKELDKRRSTASELAKTLGISVQAASEHLENLRIAGLVERADEGRKWVYFALTEKGQAVLHPERKRLWVLLSVFILLIAGAGFMLYYQNPLAEQASLPAFAPSTLQDASDFDGTMDSAMQKTFGAGAESLSITAPDGTNSTNSS